jgi:hypothetical protein
MAGADSAAPPRCCPGWLTTLGYGMAGIVGFRAGSLVMTLVGGGVRTTGVVDQHRQQFADRAFSPNGAIEGHVGLKLVAASAPISFLDHVARFGEVSDDSKGASFRDTERGADVSQPDPGIVGDAKQDSSVIGQEAPRSGVPGTHGLPFGQ